MIDKLLDEAIRIDSYQFGSDQQYVNYPSRFATVDFVLEDTDALCGMADEMRGDLGFDPENGNYVFSISLNDYNKYHVDTCITFMVVESSEMNNEELYTIDLTETEQKLVYQCLDRQCRSRFLKSCEELLKEAEEMM